MTFLNSVNDPLDDVLEHFGKKGMKWGVRRQKDLDRITRVASGHGSKLDKINVGLTRVSSANVRKQKGLQGAAKVKVRELEVRKARILKGKATVGDLLAIHGGDRIVDTSVTTFRANPKF